MEYEVILLAAGEGQRAALGYNKVLYRINGKKELVLYSLEYFLNDEFCKKVILVINDRDKLYFKNLIKNKKVKFVKGGAT
ncbi:MAG: 2-C-methyl-D-erythritol 4-phosphate cytidylyltransferase, partial [Gammaproteobacteria bacterium]|nr:2-C-methyl-D-erythritol 4-phosphate cytidylyltransferase [Gammaproteobacteria bacterium]